MRVFAPDLRYKQMDGRVIGREQLARDVAFQLRSVESADTSYVRESLRVEGERVTELLRQTASVTTRHFFVLRRVWRVNRLGSYTWMVVTLSVAEVTSRSSRSGRWTDACGGAVTSRPAPASPPGPAGTSCS